MLPLYTTTQQEYQAMLYGQDAPLAASDPSPHFQLATEGIMFEQGADVLFTMRGWVGGATAL
jgi:hypothetical protein